MKNLKVALVHDYLREYGGAERVLEVLHEIFPDAPLYTAYLNLQTMGDNGKRFKDWDIRPSWFQKFPFANRLLSPFRIFGPMMFESFDMGEYDLVISSSSATHLAKAVITKPETLHISYIHTPPRFLYGYVTSFNYKKRWWTRIGGEIINHFMRIYDFEVSQRPDILIANSKNIQARIKKFYRRDSVVIYPAIDVDKFTTAVGKMSNKKNYYLSVGRLVRGKGIEVIVEACTRLNLPLKVVGTGPKLDNIKAIAGRNVEFLGQAEDEKLPRLYAGALATIVASEDEDFGIVPVESMASGTPVIAPASGGFLETVVNGKTGILYGGPGQVSVESLMEGIKRFDDTNHLNAEDLRKNAQKFSKERFKKEILDLIDKNVGLG